MDRLYWEINAGYLVYRFKTLSIKMSALNNGFMSDTVKLVLVGLDLSGGAMLML